MKFLSDIEVEEGLKDSDGDLGTAGQVLSSTSTGTNWIDAPSGTIGGSITDNQIAVGASTSNSIEGTAALSFTGGTTQRFTVGDGTSSPAIYLHQLENIGGGGISFRVRTPNVSTLTESEIRLDSNKYLQINSSEKIYLDGETNGVVITGNGQISVKEFANSTGPTHTAGFGTLWVDPNSGSANKLYYTDDVGTDYDLTAGSGITGSGTANFFPKFTASTVIGNSMVIYEEESTTPVSTQQIVDGSFANGSTDWQVGTGSWSVASGKATCNGTNASDPIALADVLYQVSSAGVSANDSVSISFTISDRTTGTLNLYSYGVESTFVGNGAKTATITSTGNTNFYFYTEDGFDGSVTAISAIAAVGGFSGGIGIETSTPKAKLDVNGTIRLSDSDDDDDIYAGTLRWADDLTNTSPSGSKRALQISNGGGWEDVIAFVQDYV